MWIFLKYSQERLKDKTLYTYLKKCGIKKELYKAPFYAFISFSWLPFSAGLL
jgi:hypothetical protein